MSLINYQNQLKLTNPGLAKSDSNKTSVQQQSAFAFNNKNPLLSTIFSIQQSKPAAASTNPFNFSSQSTDATQAPLKQQANNNNGR
jgi:hypothetical protein